MSLAAASPVTLEPPASTAVVLRKATQQVRRAYMLSLNLEANK